mmetsp:Transcript_2458/g.4790  ORF Transcript_2458/g.4790 Transcript_2458/m.4790 type:complete len:807 (-) Transcript_2458:412-2832(-)
MRAARVAICILFLATLTHGWTELHTSLNRSNYDLYPPPLTGHSTAVWQSRYVLVYGGQFEITHRVVDMLPRDEPIVQDEMSNCTATLNNCTGYGYCRGNATDPYCDCIYGYTGHMCQLGMDYKLSSDVWILDLTLETWRRRRYAGSHSRLNADMFEHWPRARYFHSAVIVDDTMYIYGGYGRDFVDYSGQLWEYNINQFYGWSDDDTGRWYKVEDFVGGVTPGAIWMHSAVFVRRTDQYGGVSDGMLIYGGMSRNKMLDQVWWMPIYSPFSETTYLSKSSYPRRFTRKSTQPAPGFTTGPGARLRHAMLYHPVRDMLYVYGGYSSIDNYTQNFVKNGSEFFRDTLGEVWALNMSTYEWSSIKPMGTEYPPPTMGHKVVLTLDCLVVFGGYWANKEFGDIWRFNLTSLYWVQQKYHYSITTFPTKRYEHSFVFHEPSSLFYVFAGQTSRSTRGYTRPEYRLNDLWKYNLLWCPNNCADRGACIFGYCFCEEGYYGYDCQEELCPASKCWYEVDTLEQNCKMCNNRGLCKDGVCRCNDGYKGETCDEIYCEFDCYNRGNCSEVGECYEYFWDNDKILLSGGASVYTTDTNETVIHSGLPRTTSYITIPIQRRVTELAGIKLHYTYQTLHPPLASQGPIVNYYIYHREGLTISMTPFGSTGVLDDYYRDVRRTLWSPTMKFEREGGMNVYVSDTKTVSIVIEIQNQERALLFRPEPRYQICFLTKTKDDLQCECDYGWWGRLCDKKWCECSGHGSCTAINGKCECDSTAEGKWVGRNCSVWRPNAEATTESNWPFVGIFLMVAVWFNTG